MHWCDKNLRSSFQKDLIFGGMPTLFVDDNGQIPPVLGISIHRSRQSNGHPIPAYTPNYHGHKIYMKIKNMKLTVIHRQENREFIGFLNRLRDGKTAESDVNLINETCSETGIIHMEGIEGLNRFKGVNVINFLMTNQLCTVHNMKSLQSLNSLILRINAKHEGDDYFLRSETSAIN